MVEALARRDYPEADKIRDTCQRLSYRMADAGFTEGVRCVTELAMMTRIRLLQMMCSGVWNFACVLRSAVRANPDGTDEHMDNLMTVDAKTIGIWLAWDKFCNQLGLDPEKAICLGVWELPASFKVGVTRGMLESSDPDLDLEPDAETYTEHLDLLQYRWSRVQKIGRVPYVGHS